MTADKIAKRPTPLTRSVYDDCEQTDASIYTDFGKMIVHARRMEQQRDALMEALEDAAAKLRLYRAASSGEYVGGREYNGLMRDIDETLAAVRSRNG